MADTVTNPTKILFESLVQLYKQSQLLLLDADRLMAKNGWEPNNSAIFSGLSYSLSNPERWYMRWASRFYLPTIPEGDKELIEHIAFVSIHLTSDHDTKVEKPLVSAGWLLYEKPMDIKEATNSWDYWMCKYWFYDKSARGPSEWHKTGKSAKVKNLRGTETFAVPLFDVISSDKLNELVINPLMTKQRQQPK